ncbi:MAG: hypothetical protein RR877_09835, partial [Aurantimicrobium sp.]|uniref:hypothetical protein n=1 Tax=Aurantimicrobium sp. TaxID=1930784 RepID=UPI002FC8E5D1
CHPNGGSYYSRTLSEQQVAALMPAAQEAYRARLHRHSLEKGVRPWELVNCTANNDPNDIWIGMEWETGFKTLNEYRAVVDYMWKYHNNWAIDAEGIGAHFGEFTFPPCNLSDYLEGKSMMDSVRNWMKSKGIVTPRNYEEITPNHYDYSGDATDNWGCHVNISVPMTRDNRLAHFTMNLLVTYLSRAMEEMSDEQQQELFGRTPYGYGGHRTNPDGTEHWWEWKLFRTPVSDEEVENIRKVAGRLALLLGEYSTNPKKYFVNLINRRGYYTAKYLVPTGDELFNYLSERSELVTGKLHDTSVNTDRVDPSLFASVN